MKTSSKIIAMGLIMACVACGAKKSTQSGMEENQQEMAANNPDMSQENSTLEDTTMGENGMNNEEMNAADSSGDMDEGAANGASSVVSDKLANANKNVDYLDMYSKLEMTNAQIRQFEGALTEFHTQQLNTPSGEMMGSLADERDRQLKEILSEEQYSTYESWKESN